MRADEPNHLLNHDRQIGSHRIIDANTLLMESLD
jgi:hypothetical protein